MILGLNRLFQSISRGATHDSAERSPAPKCHEKTRLSVTNDIMSWIGDPDRDSRLLWLNSAPGVGKSAISQTIAEKCAEREQLAGTFFFSGKSTDRKTAERLFFTLAYQFAIAIPAARVAIKKKINADPHILSKSIRHQLDRLILRPLSHLLDPQPMVIIVDGLDECDVTEQDCILELIPTLLSGLPRSFCLLVTSRPEPIIREAFDGSLQYFSRRVTLDGRYAPEKDIETFLRCMLARHSKRRFFPNALRPWPLDSDIRALVDACSDQFLCAATIARYIDDGPHPNTMMKNLLSTTGSKHAALAPLDTLYSRILSTCPDPAYPLSILGVILVSSCQMEFIEGLLGLEPGEVAICLRGFNSVLEIPQEDDKVRSIRIRHPSFREFLLDSSRSREYFIDIGEQHARVATYMLTVDERRNFDRSLRDISQEYWGLHCSQATLTDDLLKALEKFDLWKWLEIGERSRKTSDLGDVMTWMSKVRSGLTSARIITHYPHFKQTNDLALNLVHARWMNISDFFSPDFSPGKGHRKDADTFLVLNVIATMAIYLELDISTTYDILEPFIADQRALWLTLDTRIGIRPVFDVLDIENTIKVTESFYHDTLALQQGDRDAIQYDLRYLTASNGNIIPLFDLNDSSTFSPIKLDSPKCHTHFALACLSHVSNAASHSGTTQFHGCKYANLLIHSC